MSMIKSLAEGLGIITAATAAYIAQDVVAESCREENTEKRTEVLVRLIASTVVFAVAGAVSKSTMDWLFGSNPD